MTMRRTSDPVKGMLAIALGVLVSSAAAGQTQAQHEQIEMVEPAPSSPDYFNDPNDDPDQGEPQADPQARPGRLSSRHSRFQAATPSRSCDRRPWTNTG